MAANNVTDKPPRQVEADIANACVEAAVEVLRVSAGVEVRYAREAVNGDPKPARGLSGTVALTGDWNGSLSFSLAYALASDLFARMLGCTPDALDEECICDGVGEFANQVAGRLKTELSKEGRSITIGIPQVTIVEAWSAPIQDMETAFILESLGCPIVLGLSADIDH